MPAPSPTLETKRLILRPPIAADLELERFGYRVDAESPGCTGCSFVADHFDGVLPHLNGHGVTLVTESIAPLEQLRAYARRMDWTFPWVCESCTTPTYKAYE